MKQFITALVVLTVMAVSGAEGKEVKKFTGRISFCNWNDRAQCPNKTTASGKIPREGYVALSKDIVSRFNLKFGQPLYIRGYGRVEYQCKTGDFFTKKDGSKFPIINTLDVYKGKNVWKCFQAEVTIVEWE